MDEEKNSPTKNTSKNKTKNNIGLISGNKRLILETNKPFNNIQLSSQFRVCNRRYLNEKKEEGEKKQKNTNINIFRLNSASKNIISLSQEKIQKEIKQHQDNLKKIKELEKLLEELNKNKNDLNVEIDKLNNEENSLKNDLEKKEDEEKELNEELDELKNINEDKNREYLHLIQLNQQQINNNNNNNRNNNRRRRENNNNVNDEQVNDLFNSILRIQQQANNENENNSLNDVDEEQNIIINESSNIEINIDEDFGPPMTFQQIEDLQVGKYPKKETYEEKCILCGFALCYNDSIVILDKCKHTFHKECLGNFFIFFLASKCPICKESIV